MSEYFLGVGPAANTRPTQIINDYSVWTLSNNLDEGCSIRFSSRGRSLGAGLIRELDTDVWVYRNGLVLQRFRITSLTQRWDAEGEDVIEVIGICYRSVLRSRHVMSPLSFASEGQGNIVAALVAHTQSQPNGDFGLTIGALENTISRTRSYSVGDNIFDAISDFTKVQDGIAWDIDGNLELTVRPFFDYPLRSTPIQLGATAQSMNRPSNADEFANVSIVSGDVEATTTVVLGTPGLVSDPRGRWEKISSIAGEQNQVALEERAFGTLDTALSPPSTWTVELVPFRFDTDLDLEVGDLVALVEPPTIAYRRGPADAVLLQVVDRLLSVTSEGNVSVTVSGVEITAPNPILTIAQARLSVLGAAPNQRAAGGVVTTDGLFLYHTFTEVGEFVPLPEFGPLDVECLLVGAGGGGGDSVGLSPGGGGGAGEVFTNVGSPITLLFPTAVIVGAGGSANNNGSQTVFAGLTAAGGGSGATSADAAGNGASGGGGVPVTNITGGTGTAGNNGGSYIGSTGEAGGAGGGGAGTAGFDTNDILSINKIGGVGGDGVSDMFLGVPTTRAGGGGGGYYFAPGGVIPSGGVTPPGGLIIIQPFVREGAAGGSGGGGAGGGATGANTNGEPGVSGTGGGGGGGSFEVSNVINNGDGGNGGSGIVIVRYLA